MTQNAWFLRDGREGRVGHVGQQFFVGLLDQCVRYRREEQTICARRAKARQGARAEAERRHSHDERGEEGLSCQRTINVGRAFSLTESA